MGFGAWVFAWQILTYCVLFMVTLLGCCLLMIQLLAAMVIVCFDLCFLLPFRLCVNGVVVDGIAWLGCGICGFPFGDALRLCVVC